MVSLCCNKGSDSGIWLVELTCRATAWRNHHLPRKLAGERIIVWLLTSSSSPGPSTQRAPLLTLTSELALLLVARGESETLTVLLLAGPDLTLYMEDAGMLVISGRRLPGIVRLISCLTQNYIKTIEKKKQINITSSY